MKEYIRIYRNWRRLARPNKWLWFGSFLMVVATQVLVLIIIPMFSAKLTSAMSNTWYNKAIIIATIVLGLYALKNLFWHGDYLFYSYIVKDVYARISNEFIDKTLNAKKANFDQVSKERILNTIHTDVFTVADFGDRTSTAVARLLITIVSLGIIFAENIWAGLIVLVADILDFVIFSWFQHQRQIYVKKMRAVNDKQYEKFSEIVDKRDTIKDLGQEKRIKKEYNQLVNEYIDQLKKRTFWDSMKDNQYQTIYRGLIFVATIICIIFVQMNAKNPNAGFDLATYFIIVAYVTDGITATKDLYNVTYYFNEVNVATQRVKAIIDFVDREEVSYGKNSFKDILGSICFTKVSYKKDDEGNPTLRKFDILIKEKETTLLLGAKSCGKRTVFNILRRAIKPAEGQILVDGVDIFEYTSSAYRNIFSYVTTSPVFFKGTIISNLTIQEKNRKVVYQVCKELGIYDYINSLPHKFQTNILNLPYDKLYLLGIARAILTTSQVLVLYEFPSNLSDKERETVLALLRSMHGTRTIIIFSAKDFCIDLADKIVKIESGEIKGITYNDQANFM
ncbi:MAG: ABC transporter ATP-binding protein [Clostridia bacterium]|nr:ABC transporter ATP-binding protein [Clostridia bacterium]